MNQISLVKNQSINKEKKLVYKKKKSFLREILKNKFLYAMTLPGIVFFIIFSYVPMAGIVIAFQNFNYTEGITGSKFVGLKNFEFLLMSKDVKSAIFNTLFLNILFIISGTIMAVFLAILFVEAKNKTFKRITQSISILPNFMSWTVIALFIDALINTNGGILYNFLKGLGINIQFYQNPKVWPLMLVIMKIWQGAGFGSIVYIATATGFDPGIYEAASIDGANRLQRILKITVPMLKPTIVLLTLFSVGKIFYGDFGMIYAVVGDNPLLYPTTDVIDTFVYRALRTLGDVGMSSAAGLLQSLLGFILVLGANKLAKKIEPDSAIF